MRTLLIMLIAATALLFTACQPECQEPVFDEFGNFSHMQDTDCNTATESSSGCITNFTLGQPDSGAIRAIQVDTQDYRNGNGDCVFDLSLYEAGLPLSPTDISWSVNGELRTVGQSFVTVEVPVDYMEICVSYTVGNQTGSNCRSFFE